jgi:peptidoglycan/xylan/chitin deacetylase (PgdA/CDA1 family)
MPKTTDGHTHRGYRAYAGCWPGQTVDVQGGACIASCSTSRWVRPQESRVCAVRGSLPVKSAGGGLTYTVRLANRLAGPALVRSQRRRGRGVVLLYHRVGPEDDPAYQPLSLVEFHRHLDIVTSMYEVVPLDVLVRRSQAGRSLRGLCSVTFDDGYRDFLENAYPVLERRQVPATHFLVSDCVDTGQPTWNYRLNRLLPFLRPRAGGWKAWLGSLSRTAREEWLAQLEEQHPISAGAAMIRATDLDLVDDRLVGWGSHSTSHAVLGGVSPEVATDEVERSRSRLRELGAGAMTLFAYPNGSHSATARRAVSAAGYQAAFAVGQRAIVVTDDPFAIGRFDVGGRPADELLLELTGALQGARDVRRAMRR